MAFAAHALGSETRPYLARATERSAANARDGRDNQSPRIAEMAGRIGAFDVVEDLDKADWNDFAHNAYRSPWFNAARGCAKAGNIDRALGSMIRFDGHADVQVSILVSVIDALTDAGHVERAQRLHDKFKALGHGQDPIFDEAFLIARARRGEDVLEQATSLVERAPDTDGIRDAQSGVAKVAIATIGFARAMKRRIGV
jgi:hypothetical protein